MSVSLTPNSTLGFNRPLTQLVKRTLTVTNNNEQPIAFKVKTTAPKLYCVRPNSGRVEPGESAEVQVLLQAMKEEPPLNVKCKDKFLVQSTIITPDKEALSLHDLWNTLDGEESKVHQQKIKVAYLPPAGEPLEEEDEGANQSSLMNRDAMYETVRQTPAPNGHAAEPMPIPQFGGDHSVLAEPQAPLERAMSPAANYSVAQEMPHEDEHDASRHSIPIVNVNVHTPPPPSPPIAPQPQQPQPSVAEDELRGQLNEAQSEIQRLRSLLASVPDANAPELRRRNRALSDDSTIVSNDGTEASTFIEQGVMHQPEGVPPQVVIMIALGVFITTYLFF